jgi:hypothetical protein
MTTTMSNDTRKSWIPVAMMPGATPSSAPMEPVGFEASWEQCRGDAARVEARDVTTFKANASVALHNVRAGVAAVLAERAWFEAQPDGPRVDFARVAGAETAAEALAFAATRANAITRLAPSVRQKITRARKALLVLRSGAEGLVASGVLAADEMPNVNGRGPLAMARACMAYAALFRAKQPKMRGFTAVKAEHVRDAATLGSELLREVKPRGVGAQAVRPEVERAAADDRDRMAVLVAQRYDYVERVAAWRWGRACEAIVPRMLSRDVVRGDSGEELLDDEELDATDDTLDAGEDEAAAEEGDDASDDDTADDTSDAEEAEVAEEPAVATKAAPATKAAARAKAPAKKAAPKTSPRKAKKP